MSERAVEASVPKRGGSHMLNEAFFLKHHEEAARILDDYPAADILRGVAGNQRQKRSEPPFQYYLACCG